MKAILFLILLISIVHSKQKQIQETCDFKCPYGLVLTPNPSHTPTSNGCGSEFPVPNDLSQAAKLVNLFSKNKQDDLLQSIAPVDIESCCDEHDMCYSECKNKKEECDDDFYQCMVGKCPPKNQWQCEKIAKMYHTVVGGWGCEAYQKSQEEACLCSEPE